MAFYFDHDYNARRDPKLIRLRRIKGMKGIGIYWCLIEIMHEQEGMIKKDEINSIAFELQDDENVIIDILENYELFEIQQYYYCNTRVLQSIGKRIEKSSRGRNNVLKRWKRENIENQEINTTVLQKPYKTDTKEKKERNIINKATDDFWSLAAEVEKEQIWVEAISMKYKLSKTWNDLSACMGAFVYHLISTNAPAKTKKEFKEHFNNWLATNANKHKSNNANL
jgi:hypothetical protein